MKATTDPQDQDTAPAPSADDALKQRLIGRIVVAALVIVALLGGLAAFETVFSPAPAPPAEVAVAPGNALPATEPAPGTSATDAAAANGDKPAESTQDNASETLPPLPAAQPGAVAQGKPASLHPNLAPALPQITDTPAEETAAPVVALPAADKAAKTAAGSKAAAATTTAAAASAAAKRANAVPSKTAQAHGAAPRPLAQMAEAGQGGWALQVGIFSNPDNAEDLRAKLEAAGIPAVVETRVRAGPFANRAEADAARSKLRALGLGESILVSVRK